MSEESNTCSGFDEVLGSLSARLDHIHELIQLATARPLRGGLHE